MSRRRPSGGQGHNTSLNLTRHVGAWRLVARRLALDITGETKMLVRVLLVLAASLLSISALAGGSEQLCTAGGYYSGAQDRFMSGLATHILQKRGELGSKKCSSLWQTAFEVGERFSKTGQIKPTDSPVLNDASAFSIRVYSSVAKGAGY